MALDKARRVDGNGCDRAIEFLDGMDYILNRQ